MGKPKSGKPSRVLRLSREASWLIFGQILTVLGTFLLIRLLTERITPALYGEIALGLTFAGLINNLIFGGIAIGVGRYYSVAYESGGITRYFQDAFRLFGYGVLAALVLGCVLLLFMSFYGINRLLMLVTVTLVYSIVAASNSILSSIQNAARQRSIVALHSGADSWLKCLFVLLLVGWLGKGSAIVVLGYLASALIVNLSQIFFIRRRFPSLTDSTQSEPDSWMSRIWALSWPYNIWGVFTWAQQAADKWFLGIFSSTSDTGLYAVLFQLSYAPVVMIAGLVTTFITPIIFQRLGGAISTERNLSAQKLMNSVMFLYFGITAIAFLAAQQWHAKIFSMLVSAEYLSVSWLMPWMILAAGIYSMSALMGVQMAGHFIAKERLPMAIGTSIIGILATFTGSYLLGIEGVALALVFHAVVSLIWSYSLFRKYVIL